MTSRVQPLKAFLSRDGFPERGTGRPPAVAITGLTPSLSGANCHYFHHGPSFPRDPLAQVSDYSGRAAILSRERPGAFLVPSLPPLLSSWTYRLALPRRPPQRLTGEVGLSPVNVVGRFVQATPPSTRTVRVPYPSTNPRGGGYFPQGFLRLRRLAHHPSRTVMPPGLSSPGPFVAVRYLPTLAAYLGKAKFE
jgi:hypothetical protein